MNGLLNRGKNRGEVELNVKRSTQGLTKLGQIRAVLFDLFDTLLLIKTDNNIGERCVKNIHRFLNENGVNVSFEDFRYAYSKVRKRLYEKSHRKLEEPHFSIRIFQTLRELGYNYDVSSSIVEGAVNAYSEEFMRHIYPDEDAHFVLRRLRENDYKTGVISNFAIPECARNLINIYGLKSLLDIVVISAEINRRKPSSEIFSFALNLLEVDASVSVFIGDTPDVDVRGAKNVGMKAILIERRKVSSKTEDQPDFTIKKLREILELLEEI